MDSKWFDSKYSKQTQIQRPQRPPNVGSRPGLHRWAQPPQLGGRAQGAGKHLPQGAVEKERVTGEAAFLLFLSHEMHDPMYEIHVYG